MSDLARMVDALEGTYGPIKPPVTKPFDIVLHENASYLVDDSRRLQVYRALRKEIGTDPAAILKQFPGVGDPLADKILLFSGAHTSLSPDSNALRVLIRLGYGVQNERNDSKMYRSAVDAAKDAFATPAEAQRAHLLLRHHGQELCKRTAPRCGACPLRASCAFYRLHIA